MPIKSKNNNLTSKIKGFFAPMFTSELILDGNVWKYKSRWDGKIYEIEPEQFSSLVSWRGIYNDREPDVISVLGKRFTDIPEEYRKLVRMRKNELHILPSTSTMYYQHDRLNKTDIKNENNLLGSMVSRQKIKEFSRAVRLNHTIFGYVITTSVFSVGKFFSYFFENYSKGANYWFMTIWNPFLASSDKSLANSFLRYFSVKNVAGLLNSIPVLILAVRASLMLLNLIKELTPNWLVGLLKKIGLASSTNGSSPNIFIFNNAPNVNSGQSNNNSKEDYKDIILLFSFFAALSIVIANVKFEKDAKPYSDRVVDAFANFFKELFWLVVDLKTTGLALYTTYLIMASSSFMMPFWFAPILAIATGCIFTQTTYYVFDNIVGPYTDICSTFVRNIFKKGFNHAKYVVGMTNEKELINNNEALDILLDADFEACQDRKYKISPDLVKALDDLEVNQVSHTGSLDRADRTTYSVRNLL